MKKIILSAALVMVTLLGFSQTQDLPTTTVRDLNGKQVPFNEAFEKGKVTLVSFWATWCIPCKHEIKNIQSKLDKWQAETSFNYMTVSIETEKLSETKVAKAMIVSFNKNGNPISEGGSAKWNWMTTKSRSFGDYAVMLDSIPPRVTPKNFKDQTSTVGLSRLEFTLYDNLAGVKTVTATLNGKWVLLEQDPKNSLLYYTKDERFIKGQNTFRIKATDAVGNSKELNITVQ